MTEGRKRERGSRKMGERRKLRMRRSETKYGTMVTIHMDFGW